MQLLRVQLKLFWFNVKDCHDMSLVKFQENITTLNIYNFYIQVYKLYNLYMYKLWGSNWSEDTLILHYVAVMDLATCKICNSLKQFTGIWLLVEDVFIGQLALRIPGTW